MTRERIRSTTCLAGVASAMATVMILISASPSANSTLGFAANEASTVASLRSIAAMQAKFRAAVDVDTNCDGDGEFGYFAELAGSQPMRATCSFPCSPCAGASPGDDLNPPLLRGSFGALSHSLVSHHGYLFQIWLPAAKVAGIVSGVAEDWNGGKAAAPFPDPVNGARLWCCYAWPRDWEHTGQRAFFVNQLGEVLETANRTAVPYNGDASRPGFDAAFSVAGDMSSPPSIGTLSTDGRIWWPVD